MSYKSDEINELAAALSKAQSQFKPVGTDKKVSIPTRDGKSYSYDYATLSTIMEAIRKPLSDNGLAISQPIVGDELLTILMHESGQFIVSNNTLPTGGDIKAFGANISYIRRYALAPLVGIAVGEEDDENVTNGQVELKPARQPAATNGQAAMPAGPVTSEPKSAKPFKFPSTAAEMFFKEIEASTDNYFEGNGFRFAKTIEKLGLNFGAILSSPEKRIEATAALSDYARTRRAEKVAELLEAEDGNIDPKNGLPFGDK